MTPSQMPDKKPQRHRKVHKRLLVNGAEESDFHNTFERQPRTVHPPSSPPTDTLTQGRQTGPSNRYSNPQGYSQLSGLPAVPELGQAAHANHFAPETVGTHTVFGHHHVQSKHAAPIPNDTAATGEAPSSASSHTPSLYDPFGVAAVFAPHNSEAHFDARVVYETMPQMYPQDQSPLDCQWGQASFPFPPGMGAMRSSQLAGAQHPNTTTGHQLSGRHLQYMQQSTQYHPSHQFPPMYAASNHVDSSSIDNGHYSPASNSPGSGYNDRVD